jgi:sugar lactone lactonase YvrE
MNSKQVELIVDAKATLGEGPAWDAKTHTLYWVDILEKRLHIYDGADRSIQLKDYVGCLAPCKDGRLILALRFGFWTLDLAAAKMTEIAVPRGEPPTNRFNDGKCDPAGRLLAGTMDMNERAASGALYSLSPNFEIVKLLDGIRISNGLAWSPDSKTLYYIDTPTREVKAFDYDLETGQIGNMRVVIRVPEKLGFPDGMTSDMDGHLWIAMWGGAQVTRWDARRGTLLEQVQVPAWNVTSCVFGGEEMNELYITSARSGMDAVDLSHYPHSGGLFRLQTNVRGMPTFEFGAS